MRRGTSQYLWANGVLKNNLDIHDDKNLEEAERRISSLRFAQLLAEPPNGELGLDYLCGLHQKLFGDIYPWAGQIRTVNISKGGTTFCYTDYIQSYAEDVFHKITQPWPEKSDKADAVRRLAYSFAEINALHPFRDGNGRTNRLFSIILAKRNGWTMDLGKIPHEALVQASILSMSGDNSALEEAFGKVLTPIEKTPKKTKPQCKYKTR